MPNWDSGSGEDENLKNLQTYKWWLSKKLTWAFNWSKKVFFIQNLAKVNMIDTCSAMKTKLRETYISLLLLAII